MAFTADLVAAVGQLLADNDVGTWNPDGEYDNNQVGITDTVIPTRPPQLIALTVYNTDDDPTQATSNPWLQVRTRGDRDPRTSANLQDAIFDVLHNLPAQNLAGHRVTGCWRRSGPAYLGPDGNGAHEHTANYELRLHRPGPNRS